MTAAAWADTTITLREQLNQSYAAELVSYPFAAKDGKYPFGPIQVVGPGGAAAAQLTDTDLGADKKESNQSARLWFIVDQLKPLTAASYTVSQGGPGAIATDLRVTPAANSVEIVTSHLGARFPIGGSTNTTPMKDVPGPLLSMRFGNGAWGGGGSLTGNAEVTGWSSRLSDSGPVLARVVTTYQMTGGSIATFIATVVAGDSAVRWEMAVSRDHPELGAEIRLPALPGAGVKEAVMPTGYGQWAHDDRVLAIKPGPEPFLFLTPDSSVTNLFPDSPWLIRLPAAGGTELRIASRDPGAWVDPVAPLTYGGFKTWDLNMIPGSWENWKRKRIPIAYAADGVVSLRPSFAAGRRKWLISVGPPVVGERLDQVKDMVLDWPADAAKPHPRLFIDAQTVRNAWKRASAEPELMKLINSPESSWDLMPSGALGVALKPAGLCTPAQKEKTVAMLRERLAVMGNTDVMRSGIVTAALYDSLIDTDLLTPRDRALFRGQMAYLAYLMADPRCWSMERGFHSGNPNMSVSYTLTQGVIACLLSDHPMARAWTDHATAWMDKWLTDEVGPNGEWLPEGSHYGYVALEPMIAYAVAAKRAGFHDFTNDARLKKVILYFAKTNTPPDPRHGNRRVTGAFGRGTSSDALDFFGAAAYMNDGADPAFTKQMQWMWAAGGFAPPQPDFRLGGYEAYALDRAAPREAPVWGSELFPNLGVIFRSGFGTPNESYVNVLAGVGSERNLDVWTPEVGAITEWFGRGKPLSTCFTTQIGYQERHELLRDGVLLARNWGQPGDAKGPFGYYTQTHLEGCALLPRADYVRSTFVNTKPDDRDWFPDNVPAFPRVTAAKSGKLTWTRQVLFLKAADGDHSAYLVLRDTTRGGEPTAWQFWTLSENLGTPEQIHNAAFPAAKTGDVILPARELPLSNRYTALGQLGVDVEYFIADPINTPRHTLRYGGHDNGQVAEYQDLLHLQRADDGAYYLAIFPRLHGEAPPVFAALADGKIIQTSGPSGSNFAFLASEETTAAAGNVSFRGTAASVQQAGDGATLSLAAAGEVKWIDFGLRGSTPASLRVARDALTVSVSPGNGGQVTVLAPRGWVLRKDDSNVKLEPAGGDYQLTFSNGVDHATLIRAR